MTRWTLTGCCVLLMASAHCQNAKADSIRIQWLDPRMPEIERVYSLARLSSLDTTLTPHSAAMVALGGQVTDTATIAFKRALGYAHFAFGTRYNWTDDRTPAVMHLQRALGYFNGVGERRGSAQVRRTLGGMSVLAGDLVSAFRYLQPATQEFIALNDTSGAVDGYLSIGYILRVQGDPAAAEEQFQKGLAFIGRGHPQERWGVLIELATLYVKKKDPEAALVFLDQASVLVRSGSATDGRDEVTALKGEALLLQGKCQEALIQFNKSIERTGDRPNRRDWKAYLLARIANAYSCAGNYAHAYRYAMEGSELAARWGYAAERIDNLNALVVACEGKGDYREAFVYSQLAHALDDSISNARTASAVSGALLTAEFKSTQLADSLISVQRQQQAEVSLSKERSRRNFLLVMGLVAVVFGSISYRQRRRTQKALKRSDELLLNILPEEVAEELKAKGHADAKHFDSVTILFTDFKGFTEASEKLSPQELVEELNTCFKAFDHIITARGIEKIKTIGDAYMCAGGLPDPKTSSPADVVHAALEMQSFMIARKIERDSQGLPAFEMRVGIHTGPVVAGIVGVKKFQYDIWGDTVNTASRMESSGEVGQVNISEATYALVKDVVVGSQLSVVGVGDGSATAPKRFGAGARTTDNQQPTTAPAFTFTPRGKVQAKGKGGMEMYFVHRSSGW
ncbi:MAG: adenylate/guanylate cyclase domain-containing protein [Flavobacteriales bacterium]